MGYTGGYYLLDEPLVRGGEGANSHSASDTSRLSGYTVNAVNHLQETPWKINHFILDVLEKLQIGRAHV